MPSLGAGGFPDHSDGGVRQLSPPSTAPVVLLVFSSKRRTKTAVTVSGVDSVDGGVRPGRGAWVGCGRVGGEPGGQIEGSVENFCAQAGRPHFGRVVHSSIHRCGWLCTQAATLIHRPKMSPWRVAGGPRTAPDLSGGGLCRVRRPVRNPDGPADPCTSLLGRVQDATEPVRERTGAQGLGVGLSAQRSSGLGSGIWAEAPGVKRSGAEAACGSRVASLLALPRRWRARAAHQTQPRARCLMREVSSWTWS